MEIDETVKYKGFNITHPCEENYITEIAHDSLEDAKHFIDALIEWDLVEKESQA